VQRLTGSSIHETGLSQSGHSPPAPYAALLSLKSSDRVTAMGHIAALRGEFDRGSSGLITTDLEPSLARRSRSHSCQSAHQNSGRKADIEGRAFPSSSRYRCCCCCTRRSSSCFMRTQTSSLPYSAFRHARERHLCSLIQLRPEHRSLTVDRSATGCCGVSVTVGSGNGVAATA
jgi:hypothetical protein